MSELVTPIDTTFTQTYGIATQGAADSENHEMGTFVGTKIDDCRPELIGAFRSKHKASRDQAISYRFNFVLVWRFASQSHCINGV